MMAIRVGLIGAGRLGRAHLQCLAGFGDAQVAAVCDTDRARAEAAALPFGATAHINFRTLIEAERLDAIFVCLPPFARGEPEIAAARAGIHLFTEPPVALTVEKAREIQKEIEKAGVVASVAYSWRHLSGTDQAREMLRERRIAAVRAVNLAPAPPPGWRWRHESSGGQLVMEATDLIDLARYLCGEMTALCAAQFQGIMAARLPGYDIEDAISAVLRFRNGAVGEIFSCNVSPRREKSLTVIADNLELRLTEESLEALEPGRRTVTEHTGMPMATAQKNFLDAVRTGKSALIRAHYVDAVRSLEVALAANESVRTGKMVNL